MQTVKMSRLAEKSKMLAASRLAKARETAALKGTLELMAGVEPATSSLPRMCSA